MPLRESDIYPGVRLQLLGADGLTPEWVGTIIKITDVYENASGTAIASGYVVWVPVAVRGCARAAKLGNPDSDAVAWYCKAARIAPDSLFRRPL